MPQIDVQNSTLERLKKLAEPFVDTPETVILRGIDALEALTRGVQPITQPSSIDLSIDPRNIPNLTHTKLLLAKLNGKTFPRPKWNSVLDEILIRARKAGLKAGDIQRICSINVKEGKKTDEGYSYLEDINLSIQGQDSNAACRGIVTMARHLKIRVELEFMWREKDGAAHPGKVATLTTT
jgi:hypothetical protein